MQTICACFEEGRMNKMRKEKNGLIILIGVFLLYFVLGMLLSYYNEVDNSMYFGSDNSRAYVDLVDVKDMKLEHHRITVHPLMLILLQPITSLLSGVFHDARMGLIVLQAMLGAGCVWATYKILQKICNDKIFHCLLTLLYTFSFSNIIFSAVPETFIFAGFIITTFWLYIFEESNNKKNLEPADYIILFFFGIFNFGITITNYISYFIGLVYLLYKRYSFNRQFLFETIGINISNLNLIVILATLQQKIWVNSPTFIEGICDAVFVKTQFEEYHYMDFHIGIEKLGEYLVQFFCLPILSADVAQVQVNEVYTPILFQQYSSFQKIALCLLYVSLFVSILMFLKQKKKRKNSDLWCVLAVWLFNFVLHYFYGYNEAFMYSPHFLFFLFVFWGMLLHDNPDKRYKFGLGILMAFLCCYECVSNIGLFIKMTQLIQIFYGNYYYYFPIILKSLCIGSVIGGITVLCRIFAKDVGTASGLGKKKLMADGIIMYSLFVILSCIAIRINYWKI